MSFHGYSLEWILLPSIIQTLSLKALFFKL